VLYFAATPTHPYVVPQDRGKTRRFTAFVSSALDQHLILREIQTYDVAGEEVNPGGNDSLSTLNLSGPKSVPPNVRRFDTIVSAESCEPFISAIRLLSIDSGAPVCHHTMKRPASLSLW
jgi:hypothetical protein